jgi:hypothetical protein
MVALVAIGGVLFGSGLAMIRHLWRRHRVAP